MSSRSKLVSRGFPAAFVPLLLAATNASGLPAITTLSAWDTAALQRARDGAAKRLRGAECLKLPSDFTDSKGRSLQANLDTQELSAADYIQTIDFRDGSGNKSCRQRTVQLTTFKHLPIVYVCPAGLSALGSRFAQIQIHNPALAEYMLIHEMLHTLGLGENPPTSLEITDVVRRRCH
jgi:hypothetical protein